MEDKDPIIKIQDPLLDASELFKKEIGEVKSLLNVGIKTFNWLITFVIGVMFVGFLTLLFALVAIMINVFKSSQPQSNIPYHQNTANEYNTKIQK